MELCTRCKKRPAVMFITKLENGKSTTEGLCLRCARELGLPQVDNALKQMGISEEELDQMEEMLDSAEDTTDAEDTDDSAEEKPEESNAPALDIGKFMRMFPFIPQQKKKPEAKADGEALSKDADAPASAEKTKDRAEKPRKHKMLDQYCLNLTARAAQGKLDAVIGRDKELERLLQILVRRQKNNPCLIGEPGVGKTAIAEALAIRIANGTVPFQLRDKEVYLVDLTALVAGTQFRGQFESRMKGLIEEVKSLGNIILVIDEIHNIVGAGDAEGSMNAANILKPALSRGEVQIIGATTLAEYRKYIEKDAALERRFQPIIVEEPSIADTVQILNGIKGYYEQHHGIQIPQALLETAVRLSERYITDRFLPDKAIDLLDEAAAYASLHAPVLEDYAKAKQELSSLSNARQQLEGEIAAAPQEDEASAKRYQELADLKVQCIRAEETVQKLESEKSKLTLTLADLARVIEVWTGVPATSITAPEFERIDQLANRLKAHIIGQDAAVDAVARAIKRNRAGISYKRKPVSFIFAGPTGVGKTELVKTLAADLFDSPETLIRLDMSEFMEKHSVSRMIGAPPGYVGYDDAGQLTEKIRRKPYSVVLFDEIEKAHPDVLNILLQILDDGRVTDAQGRQVNFENTVIIMTTNAGANLSSGTVGFGEGKEDAQAQDRTMKALSGFLRPEFLNRVDEIITFRSLDETDFAKIAHIMLDELKSALAEKNLKLAYTDEVCAYVAKKSFSRKYGARNMRRFLQTEVEDVIANYLISHYATPVEMIGIGYDKETDVLTFSYL